MRIATSPLAVAVAHSGALRVTGARFSFSNNFLRSGSTTLRPVIIIHNPLLGCRQFSKASASQSRPQKQLAALNIKPQQKSTPRSTATDSSDDGVFPMADQYKYIAHLLTMPIRTPEATRQVDITIILIA